MDFENLLNYRILTLVVLLVFYGIYFVKMYAQSRKGIRTSQIGSCKTKERNTVEKIMSVATLGVVIVQVISLILDWNTIMTSGARFTGFCVAMTGNLLFLISVYTMRDSWRAGIPAEDETEFVSDGIYGFSRNPAFLGFDFMYVGVLLMFFNPVLAVFTVFAVLSLHLQILQEEKYLAQRFGDRYTNYKKHVFRYLGSKGR